MAVHRAIPRALVLVAAAAIAATPLGSGLTAFAPAGPAHAVDPVYPDFQSISFTGDSFNFGKWPVAAGLVDFNASPDSGPAAPTPAQVTASGGGQPLQGTAILRSDLAGTPLENSRLVDLALEGLPVDIPLSTIPFHRSIAPTSWSGLVATTALAGVPLVSVTYAQVRALPAVQAQLQLVKVGEVDWSHSILADLPLAALTFEGQPVTAINIPRQPGEPATDTTNAERWCYLLNVAQPGSCPSPASLAGKSLIELGLQGAPLKNIPLKNIPLKNIDLSASPLKNIPLKNIVLDVSPLKNIPLKNIDMAGAPLKNIPLKNILLDAAGNPTASPLKNIPLKNIAWATSPLKNIPLKNINLATSPLKNIPLKNIDFGTAPLKNIPLKNIDLATSPLKNIPLKNIAFGVAPLKNIPLKNIDLSTTPLKNIPLKNIALAGAPLKNIPLKNIAWATAPLKNIPLKNINLATSGIGAMPLAAISWAASPIGARLAADFNTAGGPFASVPATGATLAQVAAANGFTAGATLGNLNAALLAGKPDLLLGDLRLDLAGATAPAISLESLLNALQAAGATPAPNPLLADLRADLVAGGPTLGDLRLDLLTDTGVTVGDLLALLLPAAADVLLGDLRLDLVTGAPATTIGELLALILPAQPDVLLGDLRLDLATGVDALVLDAITAFLLDPATFASYLLGALGTWTDVNGHDITLGELGIWSTGPGADITLGDLAQYLDGSVSLADVLLGLVPPADFPFENFPITSLGLNADGRRILLPPGFPGNGAFASPTPVFAHFRLFNVDPFTTSEPTILRVYLAPGSIVETATSNGGPTFLPAISTLPDGRLSVEIPIAAMSPGLLGGANLAWTDDIRIGPHPVIAELLNVNGVVIDAAASGPRPVVDGAEPDTPIESIAQGAGPGFVRIPNLPVSDNGCSSLDASCVGRDESYADVMLPGFISHAGDYDWFLIPNVRAGARITADVTNLLFDADLVLYGPAGISTAPTVFPSAQDLPGRFVEDPGLGVGRAATAIAAEALNDLKLDQGYHDPYAGDVDVPAMTPLSISQHHGTDPESVGVIAPVNGDYVVQVSGYNGAVSNDPYLVRARVFTPANESVCTARSFDNPTPAAGSIPSIASDVNTVFLTNPSRLAATYGMTGANAVATKLAGLVSYLDAHPGLGLKAAVVPVDAYLPAGPTNPYTIWDANPCSVTGANGVATALTGVLQAVRLAAPDVAYVTLVGGDDILPMGRIPDLTRVANESDYAATFATAANPISAAEAAGFMLTDDAYGDTHPTSIGDGNTLFVPRLAVGRLVETPTEINALLQAYADDTDGTLDTGTGLVAGYDFLADGAHVVANRLTTGGRTVDGSLIDDPGAATPWTSTDLLAKLFPTGGASPLIASLNAHYDHTALLPSAGNTGVDGDLLTASELLTASTADKLLNRLLFTMGCHAGLAVPDAYVPGTGADLDTLRLDWAQALAQAKVAVYVANTGFGVGDTSSVAYSERLMGLYAKLLDGNLSVGRALAYAKQAYYGSLGAVGVYDFKILEQTAFYGLPFWKVSTSTIPTPPVAPDLPGTIGPDAPTGLQAMDVGVSPDLQQSPPSAIGRYWFVNGFDPQVTHYRPIEPRMTIPVGAAGQLAHGALITSLSTHDVALNPVVSTPTIDLTTSTAEAPIGATAWPARPVTVTTYRAPFGTAQDVVLVPGQFFGSPTGGSGTQRLFDTVGLKVYYADPLATDFEPPTIADTKGVPSGSSIAFTVHTNDAGAAVARVLVAFHDPNGSWQFVDLAHGSGDAWAGNGTPIGPIAPGAEVEYFVQVLDASGNAAGASNKAQLFAAGPVDTTPPSIVAAVSPAANAAGWIAGSATVSFTCSDTGSGIPAGTCPTPVTVTADGPSVVSGTVVDAGGNQATVYAPVQVDGTAPSIIASVMPSGWANAASATVSFSCSDATSGLDGTGCPSPVTVTAEGSTNVSRSVHDVAGNPASASATVRLDRTAPVVTFVTGAGGVQACSTTDGALSGVAIPAVASSSTANVNGIPTTTLVCSGGTDNAGNVAPAITQTYVAPMTFVGFQSPVNNAPTVNNGNAGRTYPIKFQLKDQDGAFITVLPAIVSTLYSTGATCSGLGDPLESQSSGNSQLTFDAATNTFQYNWKTPNTKGCYQFRLTLADGSTKTAQFNLK